MRYFQAAQTQLTEYITPPHWVVYVGHYKRTLLLPLQAKALFDFLCQNGPFPLSSDELRTNFVGTDDEFFFLIDKLVTSGLLEQAK
ncbi:hypothetical protein [Bowmanella yangjiangensis]|uniref:Uncharacterized protein n=1 Tax=Bowmanella yangjiangensis TaxID=2811230 RepID=A0ABS3CTF3_9ALTE|nr:hypothetical protein [Bowmanella yangjiangensis]MBN7820403.1 hypothetical protein [Bowmanella yangjiangensis]